MLLKLLPPPILEAAVRGLCAYPSVTNVALPRADGRPEFVLGSSGIFNRICMDCVKKTDAGRRACDESDAEAMQKASREKKPYHRRCHMGFHEAVAPIVVDDAVVAVIFAGQLVVDGVPTAEDVRTRLGKLGIDTPARKVKRLWHEAPHVNSHDFEALLQQTGDMARGLGLVASQLANQLSDAPWLTQVREMLRLGPCLRRLDDMLRKRTVSDRKRVCSSVLDEIAGLVSFGHGSIYEWVERRKGLRLVAQLGATRGPDFLRLPEADDERLGVTNRVFMSGEPRVVADVRRDEDYLSCWDEARSELCIPFFHRGQCAGVINLESTELSAFRDEHADLLRPVAEFLGRVYAVNHEAQRLEAAVRVGKAVNADLPLPELLVKALDSALSLVNAHIGAVLLWHADERCLTVEATRNLPGLRERVLPADGHPRGVTNRALAEGKTQLVNNVAKDVDYYGFTDGIRSEISVPLICRDQPIGVLDLEATETKRFTPDDRRVLEAFAVHLAAAVDKTQLVAEESRRAESWAFLTDAIGALSRASDLNAALSGIANDAARVVRAKICYVFLTISGTRTAVLKAASEGFEDLVDGVVYQVGEGFTGRILQEGQPEILDKPKARRNIGKSKLKLKAEFEERIGGELLSLLGVPIIKGPQVLGAIVATNRRPEASSLYFGPEDQELLARLAQALGAALGSAQLSAQIRFQDEVYGRLLQGGESPNERSAADSICQAWDEIRPHDTCAVLLIKDDDTLVVAARSNPGEYPAGPETISLSRRGVSVIGAVIRRGRLMAAPRARLRHEDSRALAALGEFQSFTIAPLGWPPNMLGCCVLLHHGELPTYEPHELSVIHAFRTHATRAIEIGRAFEAASETCRVDEVYKATLKMEASRDWAAMLEAFFQAVRKLGFDRVRLYDVDIGRDVARGIAHVGMEDMDQPFEKFTFRVSKDQYALHTLRTGRPQLYTGRRFGQAQTEVPLKKQGVKEWAEVPLLLGQRRVGLVCADNKKSREPIGERQLQYLALLCGEASSASSFLNAYLRGEKSKALTKVAIETTDQMRQRITALGLYAESLRDADEEEVHRREVAENLLLSIEHVKDCMNRIAVLAGITRLNLTDTDLGTFLRTFRTQSAAHLDRAQVRMHIRVEEAPHVLPLDREHMRDVLNSLLQNSIEAMSTERKVAVTVRRGALSTEMLWTDTGTGIPAEVGDQIFEPDYTTKNGPLRGLSLARARSIVLAHGGDIGASKQRRGGARIVIRLPVIAAGGNGDD